MCIIGIAKTRKLTKSEIEACFENNPDGAGFAYITPDKKVHVEKGFMTIGAFEEAYANCNVLPHVLHMRIATSGEVSPELTHPYRIEEDSKLVLYDEGETAVLFHNGVIFDWKNLLLNLITTKQIKMPKGQINDTRLAAIMTSIHDEEILRILSGKFVVVRSSGISMWGQFDEVDGVAFSNSGHKKTAIYNYTKKGGYAKNGKQGTYSDNGALSDTDWYDRWKDCDRDNENCNFDCETCTLPPQIGNNSKNSEGAGKHTNETSGPISMVRHRITGTGTSQHRTLVNIGAYNNRITRRT